MPKKKGDQTHVKVYFRLGDDLDKMLRRIERKHSKQEKVSVGEMIQSAFQAELKRRIMAEPETEPKAKEIDTWECPCPFGTYIPEKKKVHCRCHWKSVTRWLPRSRMIPRKVCEAHFPEYQEIKQWQENEAPPPIPEGLRR